jgi:pimeloyl-ACP methyl ester carboxylesterase
MRVDEKTVSVYGHEANYLEVSPARPGTSDEVIVLVHGLAGSTATWASVLEEFSLRDGSQRVIALDLMGHGHSVDPHGDYSLSGYATGVRDLLGALGIHRATVIGHSLGGGVAMQFAHQFPERLDRLVLVSSGGLGRSVHPALRAATLPGAELVLPLLASKSVLDCGNALVRFADWLRVPVAEELDELLQHFGSLRTPEGREVFCRTVRSALDLGGQRLSATDRLHLLADVPLLLMWGTLDPVIPVEHGVRTWELVPGAEIELFEGVGHFPHRADPARFVDVLLNFLARRPPAAQADPDFDQSRQAVRPIA